VFTYRLILKDESPADPPQFVTATPTWHEGDTFMSRPSPPESPTTFRRVPSAESEACGHRPSRRRRQTCLPIAPTISSMRAVLVFASTLATAGAAAAGLSTPARVTLDGVGGALPGMNVAAVSAEWGVRLRPNYEVRPTCGAASIERSGIVGQAIFMPRGRFGAVFFRKGAVTGRGIRIGSTLAELRRAYPKLSSRPDRYIHGGRNYFLRRARAPHWELRVDVSPEKRVTQIAFGERASVRLDEGCA
jgi:hypothetical protein